MHNHAACDVGADSPVRVTSAGRLLLFRGDYRLQILLPPLLAVTAIRRLSYTGDLLGLVYGRFLNGIRPIHVVRGIDHEGDIGSSRGRFGGCLEFLRQERCKHIENSPAMLMAIATRCGRAGQDKRLLKGPR